MPFGDTSSMFYLDICYCDFRPIPPIKFPGEVSQHDDILQGDELSQSTWNIEIVTLFSGDLEWDIYIYFTIWIIIIKYSTNDIQYTWVHIHAYVYIYTDVYLHLDTYKYFCTYFINYIVFTIYFYSFSPFRSLFSNDKIIDENQLFQVPNTWVTPSDRPCREGRGWLNAATPIPPRCEDFMRLSSMQVGILYIYIYVYRPKKLHGSGVLGNVFYWKSKNVYLILYISATASI